MQSLQTCPSAFTILCTLSALLLLAGLSSKNGGAHAKVRYEEKAKSTGTAPMNAHVRPLRCMHDLNGAMSRVGCQPEAVLHKGCGDGLQGTGAYKHCTPLTTC